MNNNSHTQHQALYLLAIFSLSQASILMRLSEASAELVGFLRLGLASLLLGGFWLLQQIAKARSQNALPTGLSSLDSPALQTQASSADLNSPPRPLSVWLNPWIWICGICFFLHLWTYKLGALNTSIANMMILFSTNPLWTALGSRIWLKQKLTAWHFASYALALFGLIFLFQKSWSSGSWNRGDLYSLITAFFYSAYVQTSYQARKKVANLNFAMGIYFIGCLGFFILCYLHSDSLSPIKSSTVLAVLGLVLFPTLCGHFNFTYLVRHLNLNWMSSGKLVEPVLSSLMAAWLFKEGWDHSKSIAFAFTAASVLVLIWSPRKVQTNEASSP